MTPRETTAADAAGAFQANAQVRSSIDIPPDLVVGLLGSADENLRALERTLNADLHVRGNAVTLSGEPADVALAEAKPSGDNLFKIELAQRILVRALTLAAAGTPARSPALPASPFSSIPGALHDA